MKTLAQKFPVARRMRLNAIQGRDMAMTAARAFRSAGHMEACRISIEAARQYQHNALKIARAVML